MNKIQLSKSSYCSCVQCEKILWLKRFKPEFSKSESSDATFEKGRQVGELAKGLFGHYSDISYDKDLSVQLDKTKELLKDKPNIITEASFSWDNNFCSVDILKNDLDGVEIYEVKSSTKIKDIYIDDAAFQHYVLSNLGLNVKKVCIVYINNGYVRGKKLDLKELFKIEDITDLSNQKRGEIKDNIDFISDFMTSHDGDREPVKDIGKFCFEPYSCSFWDYCTKDLPSPNVFDISGMAKTKKFEKYCEGKISFKDLEKENLNAKYLEQIDFELNNREPKINKKAIKDILDSLKYPLYFIDYESCQYAIPEYENTKPYQQIPFQYSLHIIKKPDAPLEHREFLADVWDENIIRTFAENMIKDMPDDGSVIVYNKTFEATRNKEIGKMFLDLKDEMDRFNENMVDLMIPFRSRDYYTREMKGSYSIKYVLPALYPDDPELDYSELSLIHKGDEASNAFLSLKDKTSQEQEKIRNGLLEYCKLDTYAMVKIWEKFKEVTDV